MVKVTCQLQNVPVKIKDICNNTKVGLFVASTWERHMNPYVPMLTGTLSQNTTIEPFKITYEQIYATRCFYGEGFNFNKEQHPLATSRWDKATEAAKKDVIAQEITEYIQKGDF